jgi:uncharacterized protein (DUF2236 family)
MASSPYAGNSLFPAGESTLHRVHGSVAVGLVYGQVAMLLAATKPTALKQFLGASAWVTEPQSTRWLLLVERLAGAALAMDAVILRADEEAEQVAKRVRRAHARVDVHATMVVWVLACIAVAEEDVYRRLVRPLSTAEQDAYWADWRRFGELLGLSPADMPASYAQYRAFLTGELEGAAIAPEDRQLALDTCLYLPGLPVPRRYRPLMPFVRVAIIELLPQDIRALYNVRRKRWHPPLLAAAAALSRLSHRVMPRRWPSLVDFDGLARVARQTRATISNQTRTD